VRRWSAEGLEGQQVPESITKENFATLVESLEKSAEAFDRLQATYDKDLAVRRTLRWVLGFAAAVLLVLVVAVGSVAVMAFHSTQENRDNFNRSEAAQCLSDVRSVANLYRAFDVAFDVIAKETGLPADAPAIGRAKAAIRDAVPSEPECVKRTQNAN
jgi:hypothetical protein